MVGDRIAASEILGTLDRFPDAQLLVADPAALHRRLGQVDGSSFERGDVLVAGVAFALGCRDDEPARLLQACGVGAVVCESANSAFRQSALRFGLPVLILPRARGILRDGNDVIVNLEGGTCEIVDTHRMIVGTALSPHDLSRLREASGLRPPRPTASEAETDPKESPTAEPTPQADLT